MAKEATLFEEAQGSALEGHFLLKARQGNVPPNWIKHSRQSRKRREGDIAAALTQGDWWEIAILRDWEQAYRKECFYRGIRILLELEREGSTKL